MNMKFIFCLINYYPNSNHLTFRGGHWQKPQTKPYNNIAKVNNEATVSTLLSHIKEMRAKSFIFTCGIWHRQIKSLAIISDLNDHKKLSVIANINKIIELLLDDVTEIFIFNDNATSQKKFYQKNL